MSRVFSEFELTKLSIRFLDKDEKITVECIGAFEEAMDSKVVSKKCKGIVKKKKVRGKGTGKLKIKLHCPYDVYINAFGMNLENLVTGFKAYGQNSVHKGFELVAYIQDEDGNEKIKSYPNCIIENGKGSKIENGAEEVAEIELDINVSPDDSGNGVYEHLEEDSDDEEADTPSNNVDTYIAYEALINDMGIGWNYGNVYDCYDLNTGVNMPVTYNGATEDDETTEINDETYNLWGNTALSDVVVNMIKAVGYKTIRLPITWANHTDSNGKISSVWMSEIKRAVNIILNAGMYCIINIHHDTNHGWLTAEYSEFDTMSEKLAGLWIQIADTFKNYNEHLIFEGFNEILNAEGEWSSVAEEEYLTTQMLNQTFIDTVRGTGGVNATRWLICNSYATNHGQNNLDGYKLPTDSVNKLLVQFHVYNDLQNSIEILNRIYNRFKDENVGIVIGEWGMERVYKDESGVEHEVPAEEREAYAYGFANYCKTLGIQCDWWDDGGSNKEDPSETKNFGLIGKGTANVWYYKSIAESMINGWNSIIEDTGTEEDDKYLIYNDTADYVSLSVLKATDLEIGTVATTAGYYKAGDGGAGTYTVVAPDDTDVVNSWIDMYYHTEVNTFDYVLMNNGNYAKLSIPDSEIIPAILAGVTPSADEWNIKLTCISKRLYTLGLTSKKIFIKSGTYNIPSLTPFYPIGWIGGENVTFVLDKNYALRKFNLKDFIIKAASDNLSENESFSLENINFKVYTSSDDIMYGNTNEYTNCDRFDFVLFDISAFTGDITIKNCNFLSEVAQENPYYQPVTLLWIRESVKKSITIENSTFKNNNCWTELNDTVENRGSGAGHSGYMAGGCLWISWQTANAVTDSITLSNCSFHNSTSDEAIDIWGQFSQISAREDRPTVNNILIDNCDFLINQHQSDNILSFYNLKDSNIVISNTNFVAKEPTKVMSKNYSLMNCSLTLEKCYFFNNSGVSQIWSDSEGRVNNYFVSFSADSSDNFESIEDSFADNVFTVKECVFENGENTLVRCPIVSNRAKVTIQSCEFNDLASDTGMGQMEYPCFLIFKDNIINGTYKKMFNLVGKNTGIHKIVLYNNIINNVYNILLHGTIAPQLYLIDNTINLIADNANIISGDLDYLSYMFGKIDGSETIVGVSGNSVLPEDYAYNLFASDTTRAIFDTVTDTVDIDSIIS